jgi:two-component system CheB/CheR fusion protein
MLGPTQSARASGSAEAHLHMRLKAVSMNTRKRSSKKVAPHPAHSKSDPPGAPATGAELPAVSFPLVAMGASAGGLEAFSVVLRNLPADTGMAFVLVQHLDPKHESMLVDLLARSTAMRVEQLREGVRPAPNCVYVIPPNADIAIQDGVFRLTSRPRGLFMPIDHFLRSLADDAKSRAIGVILSGTSSDGALGIEAIKGEGGITFAQDEKTAKYDGMPRAAVATGCVDFVLSPEEIAHELIRIAKHPYYIRTPAACAAESADMMAPRITSECAAPRIAC